VPGTSNAAIELLLEHAVLPPVGTEKRRPDIDRIPGIEHSD
jgi:hypothetical protein